jgi:hypothetical protein
MGIRYELATKLMGWLFLVAGSLVLVSLGAGLIYEIAHGEGRAAAEIAVSIVLLGVPPFLIGLKTLRESRDGK